MKTTPLADELFVCLLAVIYMQPDARQTALRLGSLQCRDEVVGERTTGGRQMQIEFGLTGVTHGDPPEIFAEANVIASFKAQDLGVEGKSFVEIGDPDADEGDVGNHDRMVRRGAVGALLPGCALSLEVSAHEEVATRNPRRLASVAMLEFSWRLTDDLGESTAEGSETAVPHSEAHLRHAEVR